MTLSILAEVHDVTISGEAENCARQKISLSEVIL